MWINGLQVTGTYGFAYRFDRTNILLGENGSGKSTFIKLILYALGAKISSFIDEISKFQFCDYVHMDFTTKSNNRYLVIRKLPEIDQVTMIPFSKDGVLQQENVTILNLDEYSDFLLEEEKYSKSVINFAASKTASLTYRFLLRTALVDQTTPHNRILANVPGDRNDFMNSQEMLNVATVEKILDTLNQDLQKLRLEYKQKEKERGDVNSKINFYESLRDEFKLNTDSVLKKIEKVDEELVILNQERAKLSDFKYEQLRELENTNNQEALNIITALRKKANMLKEQSVQKEFELTDLKEMNKTFTRELDQVKKQLASQKVLQNIPVTICPVCFSPLDLQEHSGLCPHCKDATPQEILDSVAGYKRMIEDTIKEVKQLIISKQDDLKTLKLELSREKADLSQQESNYIQKLQNIKEPVQNIISEIQKRLQTLTEREYKLNESRQTLVQMNVLRAQKDALLRDIESLAEDIKEAEKKSADDQLVFIRFEDTFKNLFNLIYGEVHEISLSRENFMPIIDGTSITYSNHSESIKVVAHLAYILTIFLLNRYLEGKQVNNIGLVIFDSPRDKDLDIDKYERLLNEIKEQSEGQLFLTGSYKEISVYEKYFLRESNFYIDYLTTTEKLLKKIETVVDELKENAPIIMPLE